MNRLIEELKRGANLCQKLLIDKVLSIVNNELEEARKAKAEAERINRKVIFLCDGLNRFLTQGDDHAAQGRLQREFEYLEQQFEKQNEQH